MAELVSNNKWRALNSNLRVVSWLRVIVPLVMLLLALSIELMEDVPAHGGFSGIPALTGRHHQGFYLEILIFGLFGPAITGLSIHWIVTVTKELERAHSAERTLRQELQNEAQARRELLAVTVRSQEAERQRVARELHDGIGQPLTMFLMMAEADETALEKSPTLRHAQLAATDTLEAIRRLILDLRPALLDTHGLLPALRQSAENSLSPMGIDVQVTAVGDPRPIPDEAETALFRIGQEALTNIVRHAHARCVQISLEYQPAQVRLIIADDGQGLPRADQIKNPHPHSLGLGLLSMRERMAQVGGHLNIRSWPGEGTEIAATIPFEQQKTS